MEFKDSKTAGNLAKAFAGNHKLETDTHTMPR